MKKKGFALMLALAVIFTMCFSTVTVYAASGTAITTAEELKAMEKNPSGSYYLANDIEVPANMTLFADYEKPFTGSFDGNGHKLNGYSYTASGWVDGAGIFVYSEGATFKNVNMTNVNMSLKGCSSAAALCAFVTDCTFTDVKVSGKIISSDTANVAGVVGYGYGGDIKLKNVKNSATIEVKNAGATAYAAGVAGFLSGNAVLEKCTNSGDVTLSGPIDMGEGLSAAGIAVYAKKMTSCTNSGDISVSTTGGTAMTSVISAAGVANTCTDKVTSCVNKGKVKVTTSTTNDDPVSAAGVVGECNEITKSSNRGSVSFSGKAERGGYVGGLAASATKVSQSYNKASVTAKITNKGRVDVYVGGICGQVSDMRNSYNTGAVTLSGAGFAGGLSGFAYTIDEKVTNNYTTGKIKASNGGAKGQVIGYYDGPQISEKRNIYNNYYTRSGKAYGGASVTWKNWTAKATKVSAIKSSTCPKLSSKYWKYSSKSGRLILKNNAEK